MDYNNNGYNNNDYNNNYNYNDASYNGQQSADNYQYAYSAGMQAPVKKSGNGAAITSMIFGIISIVCCCCCGMGFLCGAVAIIFAIISGKKRGKIQGMAIAGLVCGIIGLVMGFCCDMSFWVFGGGLESFWEGFVDGFNEAYYGY
ncbi:MAG: DUF4190 domain-containing protein [Lachnospiraceae bacterium]|nr:DUF4190 domain-containing protein [Lachnospiraceae bacterium]MBQ7767230.1 DUF4190 domain-containing protein [Lachnospiraceae bacterium]